MIKTLRNSIVVIVTIFLFMFLYKNIHASLFGDTYILSDVTGMSEEGVFTAIQIKALPELPIEYRQVAILNTNLKIVLTPVKFVVSQPTNDKYVLELVNKEGIHSKITVGPNTAFFNGTEFYDIKDVQPLNNILGIDNAAEMVNYYVESITYTKLNVAEYVYDIEIGDPHYFYAEDTNNNLIIIHNMDVALNQAVRYGPKIAAGMAAGAGAVIAWAKQKEENKYPKGTILDQYGRPISNDYKPEPEVLYRKRNTPPVGVSLDTKVTGSQVDPKVNIGVKVK